MKKVLTAQQVAFFNVFGYLVLPQAFDTGKLRRFLEILTTRPSVIGTVINLIQNKGKI